MRLQGKLQRLQEIYLEGDIDLATYRAERAATVEKLTVLPSGQAQDGPEVARRLLSFLRDLSTAWSVATPEARNWVARELFNAVRVEGKRVKAVLPRSELHPFFDARARLLIPADALTDAQARTLSTMGPPSPMVTLALATGAVKSHHGRPARSSGRFRTASRAGQVRNRSCSE